MTDPCCEPMRHDLERVCAVHADRADCPDALIGDANGEFGLLVHDGKTSMVAIAYCP